MRLNNKGMSLVEIVLAGVVIAAVSGGMALFLGNMVHMQKMSSHRSQAAKIAGKAAETLMLLSNKVTIIGGTYSGPAELDPALTHDLTTTPGICTLPDGYIKDELGGDMDYVVSKEQILSEAVGGATVNRGILKIEVRIRWTEDIGAFDALGANAPLEKEDITTVFSSFYVESF